MGSYRDLTVWQKAMDLVDSVYEVSRAFPKSEVFGLTQQARSAATSIPLNIAEGRGRFTAPDQVRFMRQARGSVYELQTAIEICRRQKILDNETAEALTQQANEVGRLLNGFIASLLRPKA
jgi:four helix bundle protein